MASPVKLLLVALAFVASACGGGNLDAPGSGRHAAPLRSPCQAGDLPLIGELRQSCLGGPESPLTRDPIFWNQARPCGRIVAEQDVPGSAFIDVQVDRYDYQQLYQHPGASYDEDGDLQSIDLGNGTTIDYQYDADGRLVSAQGTASRYLFRYTAGRRMVQLEAKIHGLELHDVYDQEGRHSALHFIEPEREFDGQRYFYDSNGLLRSEERWRPGGMPRRWSYQYFEGVWLQTATFDPGDDGMKPQRWTYLYDCSVLD